MPKEHIIEDNEAYLARLKEEEIDGHTLLFLHLDFRKWTPSSFKRLLRSWKLFRQTVRGTFFAVSNGDDIDKWRKFVQRLGFQYLGTVRCPDGVERPCYFSQDTNNG
jgi:hypothetical protein